MTLFVDLCVELKQLKSVKDGLIQLKNATASQHPKTLEAVMRHFRDTAEKKSQEALDHAGVGGLGADDDLDEELSPEMILLGAAQVEVRGPQERELHTSFKFLWDAYKHILDILKNTRALEDFYHETAQRALVFCKDNQRQQEFRRLVETIKGHWQSLNKPNNNSKDAANITNPNDPNTINRALATRFKELEVAGDLEMWLQSWVMVEDINELLKKVTKKSPKILFDYYENLARIFWKSENYLFHAAAWLKLYTTHARYKGGTEDRERLASKAVMAVLSIPLYQAGGKNVEAEDQFKEKQRRWSSLLLQSGSQSRVFPTREFLRQELIQKDVLRYASTPCKELFKIVECEFVPLSLCQGAKPVLDALSADDHFDGELKMYVRPLKKILFLRLIFQVANVYSAMSIDHFTEITSALVDFSEAEKWMVSAAKTHNLINIQIDYVKRGIIFITSNFDSSTHRHQLKDMGNKLEEAVRKVGLSKPLPKGRLVHLLRAEDGQERAEDWLEDERRGIHKRIEMIDEDRFKEEEQQKRKWREAAREHLQKTREAYDKACQFGKQVELKAKEKDSPGASKALEEARAAAVDAAEFAKLAADAAGRCHAQGTLEMQHGALQAARDAANLASNAKVAASKAQNAWHAHQTKTKQAEHDALEKKRKDVEVLTKLAAESKKKGKQNVAIAGAKVAELTDEQLKAISEENLQEEIRKMQSSGREKLIQQKKAEAKRVDHLARALRLEECEALQQWRKDIEEEERRYASLEEEHHRKEHEKKLTKKRAIEPFLAQFDAWRNPQIAPKIAKRRRTAIRNYILQKLDVAREQLDEEREKDDQRRRDREEEIRREQEEEEMRMAEEREERAREERAREQERERELEETERKRKQEERRKALEERERERERLDALAAKQRDREREIEERAARERGERDAPFRRDERDTRERDRPREEPTWRRGGDPDRATPPWARSGGKGAGDRRDEGAGRTWRDDPRDDDRGRRDDRQPAVAPWRRSGDPPRRAEPEGRDAREPYRPPQRTAPASRPERNEDSSGAEGDEDADGFRTVPKRKR